MPNSSPVTREDVRLMCWLVLACCVPSEATDVKAEYVAVESASFRAWTVIVQETGRVIAGHWGAVVGPDGCWGRR
ncbi:hypothetical protein [Actinomadura sp. BRA 177]|uniref:hypothetical protein n=1 Tax=Actinomadura sp. BRA 177 TaxID=2745202 RepID=UPI00159614B7|nr:hypothetical protein [Actinomadura sp. BRA 177]NVI91011.1 hypothetical protein [Actinomadura sp. BRA 177]